jgi:hypothetical protein
MALRYRAAKDLDRRRHAALEVTVWARAILDAREDAVVSVSGHQCGDRACSSAETVILLMRPDEPTQAIKIRKPLETVTRADVVEALQPIVTPVRAIRAR